jgi:Phage P22-like portal protein
MSDKDILAEQKEAFKLSYDAESENRMTALEDLRFGRLGEQWPDKMAKQRELDNRPVLTINTLPAFIRQVVNDSRMNRPQIKVKAVDDRADRKTADMLEGLIRNIEYVSKADVAYDTAVDSAASMGWGYLRIAIDYEYDDTFDKGLRIKRVANPFSVYGDPFSTEADSSDWNQAHVVDYLTKPDFQRQYKGAEEVDWDALGYSGLKSPWVEDERVMTCEAWVREKVKRKILLLSNGQVVGAKEFEAAQDMYGMMGITRVNERDAQAYKITQHIMTGAEVLETNEWAGQYIPVIPVYGEELNVEGKRYFRSLIANAKDPQRMFNYWRTAATELVALAPKVPFIGEEGAFDADPNWATSNSQTHPYLMFTKGSQPPQRQPLDTGAAAGALAEAMNASDDVKRIIGLHDASLGARSNETSGRAIKARQMEGDVSTFHFIDNLSRGIRHLGCCLIDLIPKVYSGERVVRVLGLDGKEKVARVGTRPQEQGQQQAPEQDQQGGGALEGLEHIYDLSVGKYDVAVSSGPGFTTRREESAAQMTEFIRSYPQAAPVIGDLLVKAMDWPQSDEIADRIKAMMPPQANGGMPPELQKMIDQGKSQIADQGKQIEAMQREAEVAKADAGLRERQNSIALAEKDLEIQRMRAEKQISAHVERLMPTPPMMGAA